MIACRALSFRYPARDRPALRGIDLDFAAGQLTWCTGALGSGNSTLLIALAGLAPRLTGGERDGSVTIDHDDPAGGNPLAMGIAYLGPSPQLQLSGVAATVRDELAIGPMNLGWPRARITAAVDTALAALDLHHLADRGPNVLSGGETQQVLLAALATTSPRVWLLDEPFSALDFRARTAAAAWLRSLAEAGAAVLVASDDADTMSMVAHRLIALHQGRVACDGDPASLLAGDTLVEAGAGTTDAATLARLAGIAAPRPITVPALVDLVAAPDLSPVSPVPDGRTDAAAGLVRRLPVLAFSGVTFAYPVSPSRRPRPVIDDLSFAVAPGEAVGLFGSNGAGKTTLLRLAMALEHPALGNVATLGRDTGGRFPEDFAPDVGFLFQQPERQLFAASVEAECTLAPGLARRDRTAGRETVTRVLERLALTDVRREHPYDLPLPRRRLVGLASVLVAGPELLLLDEPTAGLDAASRELVIAVVRDEVAAGKTVVAVTHDADFALEALDRGLVLAEGRLVHDGPVRDVLDGTGLPQPASLAVAIALGLPAGAERRAGVSRVVRQRIRDRKSGA